MWYLISLSFTFVGEDDDAKIFLPPLIARVFVRLLLLVLVVLTRFLAAPEKKTETEEEEEEEEVVGWNCPLKVPVVVVIMMNDMNDEEEDFFLCGDGVFFFHKTKSFGVLKRRNAPSSNLNSARHLECSNPRNLEKKRTQKNSPTKIKPTQNLLLLLLLLLSPFAQKHGPRA